MRRMLALLLALAAVLVVLWLALGRGTPAAKPESAAPAPATGTPPAAPLQIEAAPASPEAEQIELAPRPERVPEAAPQPAQAEVKLAELTGRFVLEGGVAAAGTRIEVDGWVGNDERVMRFGKPERWKDLHAICDADGRFSIRFDPPRAYQFTLEASHPGCVTAKWRWGELEPGKRRDLGETLLPRGGTITGRVVDAQGRSTHDAWQVYADALGVAKGEGSDSSSVNTSADRETGQFKLENLPPGRVELKAHSELANWIEGPNVEVRAGETVEANIVYAGPDNSRRITVVTFVRHFHVFDDEVDAIVLSAPGIEPRKATKIARSSQSFSFDELEPGTYTVSIDDPKFQPWRKEGVRPGQSVNAKLVGSASVSLAVVDAALRTPIESYTLRVRFDAVNFSPSTFEVFGAKARRPEAGLVEGLIPREQTLLVSAEGYAPCELRLESLEPREVRPVTIELRHGATLDVRVLEPNGKGYRPGQLVVLAPSRAADGRPRSWDGDEARLTQREAKTDADGRASFTAVSAGNYCLHAELTPVLSADLDGIAITDLDTQKSVELAFPDCGSLAGRVIGFERAPVEGCVLVVLPTNLDPRELGWARYQSSSSKGANRNVVAADGSFRTGLLRAGSSTVSLQYPAIEEQTSPGSRMSMPGTSIELGTVVIPAAQELQQDFDLSGTLPGKVTATVRFNGAPAARASVSIIASDHTPRHGRISLDAQGQGTSGPIAPGPVRFAVWGEDGLWAWNAPETTQLPAGETIHVSWDIRLFEGELQIVDASTGAPVVGCTAEISREGPPYGFGVQRETDEQGKLRLFLEPGPHRIEFLYQLDASGKPSSTNLEAATFDWTASGPVNAVLKVGKKP